MMCFDDREIINGCKARKTKYQKALFDKYSSLVFAICKRYLVTTQDSEDLCQEVFIKVFDKIDTFRFEGSFEGWIRRFAIHQSLNYLRQKRNRHIEINDNNMVCTRNDVLDNFTNEDMLIVLSKLTDIERAVFNMIEIDNIDIDIVAKQLNKTKIAIQTINSRTKTKIISIFKTMYNDI